MKKKYIMPHTKVVKIKFETSLLNGSDVTDTNNNADIENGGGGGGQEGMSLDVSFE